MNKTMEFHDAKSNLECALTEFLKAALEDGRDLTEEINEALFNCCKEAGCNTFKIEEL